MAPSPSNLTCGHSESCSMRLSPMGKSLTQAWLKERWCPRYSAATGCLSPTTVPLSCMISWCPVGRTDLKTGPHLTTYRVSWMTSTPPQRDSTSNSRRWRQNWRDFWHIKLFTSCLHYVWTYFRYVIVFSVYIHVYMIHSAVSCVIYSQWQNIVCMIQNIVYCRFLVCVNMRFCAVKPQWSGWILQKHEHRNIIEVKLYHIIFTFYTGVLLISV